jgi:ACS family glucarate transporter-like MFS transporter
MPATAPVLTDRDVHRASLVRYHVLGWLCAATVIAYIDRGCIAVAKQAIGTNLELSDATMGDIMAAFFFAYALFQLPAGWLGALWGTRRALPFFAVAWSVFTAAAALATGAPGLLLSRWGMGAAEAGIFPCAAATLAQWFPSTRRAFVSGVLGSFMGIGGALGAALTGVLLGLVDWRWMFVLYASLGLFWAAWFYFWFRERPADHPAVNGGELDLIHDGIPASGDASSAEPTPWRQIFSSVPMWWINGQQFFRGAGYVFYISWFPTYLMETRHVTLDEAGWLTSLPHLAQVAGSLLGGVLADWALVRTGSRRLSRQGLPFVSLTVCTTLVLGSSFVGNAWLAVLVITVGAFCASLAGPCAYAATMDMGGRHTAAVFSTMNMAGNVGAILFPMAIPRLVAATGRWDLALFVFAGLHLAAAVCWLFVNPHATIVGAKVAESAIIAPPPETPQQETATGIRRA